MQYPLAAVAYPESNTITVSNLSDKDQPHQIFKVDGPIQKFIDLDQGYLSARIKCLYLKEN